MGNRAESTLHPRSLQDLLAARKFLEPAVLARHVEESRREGVDLEEVLLRSGAFTRAQLLQILENEHFCPAVDLHVTSVSPDAVARIPRNIAERIGALPVQLDGERIVVAFANPPDEQVLDALSRTAKAGILPRVALPHELKKALDAAYDRFDRDLAASEATAIASSAAAAEPPPKERSANLSISTDGASASAVVLSILEAAARHDATDVHIHPGANGIEVRFRIDGLLHSAARLRPELTSPVVARIKVLSNLDIAEHRIPQDGRLSIEVDRRSLDLRVSVLPSQHGENVVIRLLRKDMNLLDLENLQMPAAVREAHADMVKSPLGFYLVTGPTGSGKTTTLYATLNSLDRARTNIVTLEDPIEYELPGITQVQIHEGIGLSFASGLRSILRQDPDVVLVGEIRDLETVEIACRAALTGHKVLSTIHTNDACQAITRMLDMGTPPHLIAATLRGVLAQRLVRTICTSCKESYEPSETEIALLGYPKETRVYRGRGCSACADTGYRGRFALFEYFRVEETMHRLILDRASPFAIRHAAQEAGMILMSDFAKRAVLEGRTTVAEIQRVVLSAESRDRLCTGCSRVVGMDFSVCPFCQHVLKESCGGCGTPIDSTWEACPTCGKGVERAWQKMFCRSCLAPVDSRWTQCLYCGEAFA